MVNVTSRMHPLTPSSEYPALPRCPLPSLEHRPEVLYDVTAAIEPETHSLVLHGPYETLPSV